MLSLQEVSGIHNIPLPSFDNINNNNNNNKYIYMVTERKQKVFAQLTVSVIATFST